jgi:hypothetical protein
MRYVPGGYHLKEAIEASYVATPDHRLYHDNTTSGLTANTVQAAIVELVAMILYGTQASVTFNPAVLADSPTFSTTITVTGAVVGDFAAASFVETSPSANIDQLEVGAKVTAADTVTVYFTSHHTAPLSPTTGTLRVRVWAKL